jgi:hypothetical protein
MGRWGNGEMGKWEMGRAEGAAIDLIFHLRTNSSTCTEAQKEANGLDS